MVWFESFLGTLSNIFLKPEKFSQWSIYWVSVGLWNTKAPPITVISDNSLRLWLAFSRCEKPERQFSLVPSEEQGFLCSRILCESASHLLRCLKILHAKSQSYFRSITFFSSNFTTQLKKKSYFYFFTCDLKYINLLFFNRFAYTMKFKNQIL